MAALARLGQEQWALLAGGRSLYRSTDGIQWRLIAPVGPEWPGTSLLPAPEGVFIGTEGAHLLRFSSGTDVVEGFELVPGREGWYTPWGGPPATRSMSRAGDGTLYVNVHVGGIPRSDDEGSSWHPTIDIDADVHQVLAVGGAVLAATALGLARSDDRGASWRFETEGLQASYSRAVAVSGGTILLSASTGPRGGRAAIYRKAFGVDGPFERCRVGLPEWFESNIDSHCLVGGDGIAAFGTDDGRVFISRNEGATWTQEAEGLPSVRCLALA